MFTSGGTSGARMVSVGCFSGVGIGGINVGGTEVLASVMEASPARATASALAAAKACQGGKVGSAVVGDREVGVTLSSSIAAAILLSLRAVGAAMG